MKQVKHTSVLVRMGVTLVSCVCASAQTGPPQQNNVPQEWQISGNVRGESGNHRGMYVIADGLQIIRPVQTYGSGRYLLKGTVPGTYSIRVQKKDDTSDPSPLTVTILKAQKLDNVNFVIAKGGVIAGRVIDRLKQPQVGLTIVAYRKYFQDSRLLMNGLGGAHSNDLGEYRIANLPPGTYVVAAVTVLPKTLPISTAKD